MRNQFLWLISTAGLLLVSTTSAAERRTWSDDTGTFKVDAEFVALKGDVVTLRLADGKTLDVPINRLSVADRVYAAKQPAAGAAPSNPFVTPAVPPAAVNTAAPLTGALIGARKTAVNVERDANACRTAREALLTYQIFLADPAVTAEEKQAAESRLEVWKDRARQDMQKWGTSWVEKTKANDGTTEARMLVRQGLEFLRLNNASQAQDTLVRAAKADPTAVEADFVMGLVWAHNVHNLQKAKEHFNECLRRDPENVRVLNNLALIEIKTHEYDLALRHIRAAVNLSPKTPQLSQNLGRFLNLTGRRILRVPVGVQSSAASLYAQLLESGAARCNERLGWVFMLPSNVTLYADDGVQSPTTAASLSDDDALLNVGGTGTAIAPGLLITSRSVVNGAAGLKVFSHWNNKMLSAEVVAESPEDDLAIVRCAELDAPLAAIKSVKPTTGSEVIVLGSEEVFQPKKALRSTKGQVLSALGGTENEAFLHSATTKPSDIGGPVADLAGNLLAVHSSAFGSAGKLGSASPASKITSLLASVAPDVKPQLPADQLLKPEEVETKLSRSTVVIFRRETSVKTDEIGIVQSDGKAFLEDITCILCSGRELVECEDTKCANGRIPQQVKQVTGKAPNGEEAFLIHTIRVDCPRCKDGLIDCARCTNGKDPELRGGTGTTIIKSSSSSR